MDGVNELDIGKEVRDLQISRLKDEPLDTQLMVLANLLGYERMPVSIDQFLDDPYYMGDIAKNLYPFWREKLREIFPTPLHTSTPILVFTGALGTGKSTAVRFMFEYMKHRLDCLKNPYDTFGFVPGKYLKLSYFHKTGQLAQTDFIDVMDSWENMSPYFKDAYNNGRLNYLEQVCDSVRSNNNIGSDCLCFNFSELNFIPYERAHEKLDQGLKRWSSRFEMLTNYFGLCIIDTSAQGDDSIADDFIAHNPYGSKVKAIYTNRWLVRTHLNYYGQHGWFKVYCGDSVHSPFIIRDGMPLSNELDPDRFLDVPEECRPDFEFDLVTSLQDIAGISTSKTDRFIPDFDKVTKQFDQPMYGSEVQVFDFYDKTDKFIYRFDRSVRQIPNDKVIFIRADIGVVTDYMGLAIAYFDKWKIYDINSNLKQPNIIVPLAVSISRPDSQETPIYQLEEFILDLNKIFEIGDFSADQYASRQLFQNLNLNKIPNRYISVDRTDEAYIYTKTLMFNGLLHLPNNHLLKREFAELRRVGKIIDHPSNGSKDCSDAVVGAVYDLYQNIDKATLLSMKYKVNQFSEQIKDRMSATNSEFQDMLQSIY